MATMKTRVVLLMLMVSCTARVPQALPSSPPSSSPSPSASPKPSPSPVVTGPRTYGGENVVWPHLQRATSPPPALGMIVTTGVVHLADGGALPAGVQLPRIGGTAASPLVVTPCDREVRITDGNFTAVPAATPGQRFVVLDPGHGGHEGGATAPDGTHESTRNLQIALVVGDTLAGRVDRVVLTRTADRDTSLAYRVALADALRASLSVSIHLNAAPDGPSAHPGTSTFASLADPNGRRVAGVLFQSERRYLDTLTPQLHGTWVANRDAGASPTRSRAAFTASSASRRPNRAGASTRPP